MHPDPRLRAWLIDPVLAFLSTLCGLGVRFYHFGKLGALQRYWICEGLSGEHGGLKRRVGSGG